MTRGPVFRIIYGMSALNPSFVPRRLYIDNAATSFPKPPTVTDAMVRYANGIGSQRRAVGRIARPLKPAR